MTAMATPLSPSLGDSGRQGREVQPLWGASPTTLPAGQGHSLSPLVKDTALILTRRAGQGCSAVTPSDFGRSVMWLTRESPSEPGLALVLWFRQGCPHHHCPSPIPFSIDHTSPCHTQTAEVTRWRRRLLPDKLPSIRYDSIRCPTTRCRGCRL